MDLTVNAGTDKINCHPQKRAWEITRYKLMGVHEKCQELLSNLKDILLENECGFLKQKVNSKATSMPKMLIKDHKLADNQGQFPTCLVAPATKFMAGFLKFGCLGIECTFNANNVDCSNGNITQAVDLKEKLEKLNLNCHNATIASVNAKATHPSSDLSDCVESMTMTEGLHHSGMHWVCMDFRSQCLSNWRWHWTLKWLVLWEVTYSSSHSLLIWSLVWIHRDLPFPHCHAPPTQDHFLSETKAENGKVCFSELIFHFLPLHTKRDSANFLPLENGVIFQCLLGNGKQHHEFLTVQLKNTLFHFQLSSLMRNDLTSHSAHPLKQEETYPSKFSLGVNLSLNWTRFLNFRQRDVSSFCRRRNINVLCRR